MAAAHGSVIVARYGAFYHGDDDLFAHCFILQDGQRVLLFQGLQMCTMAIHRAPEEKHEKLLELLEDPIPAAWPPASYSGYNFVNDPEGPQRSEIAVYGTQAGDPRPPGEYYAAPDSSEIGQLVKDIAQVD